MWRRFLEWLDWGLLAALALTLPMLAPVLITGQMPDSADGQLHLHHMVSMGISLHNGILYPRWAAHLHAGYGYPLHNFYPPGWRYLFGWLYVELGGNAAHYWLAALALGVMLCGPGAYLFAKTLTTTPAALAATAAYTWVSIRFREIWDQGNLSQLYAMGLMVWAFWGIARLARQPSAGRLAVGGILISLVILNHHPTALIFMPTIGGHALLAGGLAPLDGANTPQERLKRIGICLVACGLGLLLAAVYWLPALTESRYTHLDQYSAGLFDFHGNFASLKEILGTMPMLDRAALNPPRPMNIGFFQWLLAGGGLLLGLLPRAKLTRWQRGHLIAGGILLAICVYLMTEASTWVWEDLPLISSLAFPWRLLGLMALLVLPGAALLPRALPTRWQTFAAMAIIVVIITSMLPAAYPIGSWLPKFDRPVTAATAQEYEGRTGVLGMVSGNEYLPKWASYTERPDGRPDPALYDNFDWIFQLDESSLPAGASYRQHDSTDHATGQTFLITSPQPFALRVRQMYFPGWRAEVDGQPLEVSPTTQEGLLTLEMPSGSHTSEVWYGGTTIQHLSAWVSLFSLAVCLALIGWSLPRCRLSLRPQRAGRRFAWGVMGLSLAWLLVNQAYVIPQTSLFRPRSPVEKPFMMQQAFKEQFFQPGIGYRLELLGYDLPKTRVKIGEDFHLTLYWRSLFPFDGYPSVKISLVSPDGKQIYGETTTSGIVGIPPILWGTDQYVRQPIRLPIRTEASAGAAQVQLVVFQDPALAWVNRAEQAVTTLGAVQLEP